MTTVKRIRFRIGVAFTTVSEREIKKPIVTVSRFGVGVKSPKAPVVIQVRLFNTEQRTYCPRKGVGLRVICSPLVNPAVMTAFNLDASTGAKKERKRKSELITARFLFCLGGWFKGTCLIQGWDRESLLG